MRQLLLEIELLSIYLPFGARRNDALAAKRQVEYMRNTGTWAEWVSTLVSTGG